MNKKYKFKIFLIVTTIVLVVSNSICSAPLKKQNAQQIFKEFCESQTSQQLSEGSYITTATDFYAALLDNGFDTELARIVILLKENPSKNHLRIDPCVTTKIESLFNWPYHSFVYYQNKVFDPIFSEEPLELQSYIQYFSKADPNSEKIMVFSFQFADAMSFLGKDPLSDIPRLNSFKPMSIKEFLENPYCKSQRKTD